MSRMGAQAADGSRVLVAWRRLVLEIGVILTVFVGAGFGAGWLWERIWTPNTGVAYQGKWLAGSRVSDGFIATDYTAQRSDFDAIALFVIIGGLTALALGVLCALLARRAELVTLGAVAVGSVLACWIAYRFGVHLAPPDPGPIARGAKDGTTILGTLAIRGASPYVCWPLGALVGLMITYFLTADKSPRPADPAGPQGWTGTKPGIAPS